MWRIFACIMERWCLRLDGSRSFLNKGFMRIKNHGFYIWICLLFDRFEFQMYIPVNVLVNFALVSLNENRRV